MRQTASRNIKRYNQWIWTHSNTTFKVKYIPESDDLQNVILCLWSQHSTMDSSVGMGLCRQKKQIYTKNMYLFLSPFSFTRSVTFLTSLSLNITQVISLVARMKCGRRWKEHTLSCKGEASALSPNKKEIPGLHGKEWPSSTCSQDSRQSVDSRLSGASIQIFPSHVSKSHSFPVTVLNF